MKTLNHIWGIAITTIIYTILLTLGYQGIFNEDLVLSVIVASCVTMLVRVVIAKLLQGVEVDFNIIREVITILILCLLTFIFYPK